MRVIADLIFTDLQSACVAIMVVYLLNLPVGSKLNSEKEMEDFPLYLQLSHFSCLTEIRLL